MQTFRDLEFADGVYRFQLGMGQILAVEEACGARIGSIHRHLLAGRYEKDGVQFGYSLEGDYGAKELMEIIRQGIVGGNLAWVDGQEIKPALIAARLVRTHLAPENGHPLLQAWDMATAIVQACVIGFEPDDPEKKSVKSRRKKQKDVTPEPRSSATAE